MVLARRESRDAVVHAGSHVDPDAAVETHRCLLHAASALGVLYHPECRSLL